MARQAILDRQGRKRRSAIEDLSASALLAEKPSVDKSRHQERRVSIEPSPEPFAFIGW